MYISYTSIQIVFAYKLYIYINNLCLYKLSIYVCMCVYVCIYVCVCIYIYKKERDDGGLYTINSVIVASLLINRDAKNVSWPSPLRG